MELRPAAIGDAIRTGARNTWARLHGRELRVPAGLPAGAGYEWAPLTGLERFIPRNIAAKGTELLDLLPPGLVVKGAKLQNRLIGKGVHAQGTAGQAIARHPDGYRLNIISDFGSGLAEEATLARRLKADDRSIGVLNLGDSAYPSGRERDWARHYDPFMGDLDKPMFPLIGNHEVYAYTLEPYFRRFPKLGRQSFATRVGEDGARLHELVTDPRPSARPTYYVQRLPDDVDVIMLDTEQSLAPGSRQRAWADEALASSTARTKIIAGHRPAFASNSKAEARDIRAATQQLAERHDVKLVLNAHDHLWERANVNGVTYVTTGGGGAMEAPLMGPPKEWSRYRTDVHHMGDLEVTPDQLVVRGVRLDDGQVFDTVAVPRTAAAADAGRGARALTREAIAA